MNSHLLEQAEQISRLSVRVANNMRIGAIIQSALPGLTTSQLQILSLIDESGPEVSMSQMARELAVTMPSVTGLVDQLSQRELVTRRHDEKDRRRVLVSLTDDGRQALAEAWQTIIALIARLLEGLSEEERESMVSSAERVHALSVKIRQEEVATFESRQGNRTA